MTTLQQYYNLRRRMIDEVNVYLISNNDVEAFFVFKANIYVLELSGGFRAFYYKIYKNDELIKEVQSELEGYEFLWVEFYE